MESVKNNSFLGLISARGGSKRVPKKNIKDFLGKPLLYWTVKAAKESAVLDRIILSTDNQEIAKIGRDLGSEVPFMRPKELAQDKTPVLLAAQHAIKWLQENEDYMTDWFFLLEPSSPGRQPFHVREVAELIKKRQDIDSIVGISEIPANQSPLKALKIDDQRLATRYSDGEKIRNLVHRTQDIEKSYFINSTIYAFKTENLFLSEPSLWGNRVLGYIMDPKYAMDIDSPEDWIIAEAKMKEVLKETK